MTPSTAAGRALLRAYGALAWSRSSEYSTGGRVRSIPPTIDSRSGTVLFKATANATDEDARAIVEIVNAAILDAGAVNHAD